MDRPEVRTQGVGALLTAAILLGFLILMAGIEHLMLTGPTDDPAAQKLELPGDIRPLPGDQTALEHSLAALDWQLRQPAGLIADSEKLLLAAHAAVATKPDAGLPVEVRQFITRSFPEQGSQLGSLLACFGGFKHLESSKSPTHTDPAGSEALADTLMHQIELQTACFGETLASRLFERYRQMLLGLERPDGPLMDKTRPELPPTRCEIADCESVRSDMYDW